MKWKREEQIETDSFLLGCFNRKRKGIPIWVWSLVTIVAMMLLAMLGGCESNPAWAEEITASWYSVESCIKEGTSGICANGEKLDDNKLTCASWDYPFGTFLKITNAETGRYVIVEVTDRGPKKSLWRMGRKIDLSRKAMACLGGFKQGVIKIKIEVL